MKSFSYKIRDEVGIHARPAGMIVKLAKESGCSVNIKKGDKIADASKLFSVMALTVKCGDTVEVTVEGENEEAAVEKLHAFFKDNL